jgi:hypothetical protein
MQIYPKRVVEKVVRWSCGKKVKTRNDQHWHTTKGEASRCIHEQQKRRERERMRLEREKLKIKIFKEYLNGQNVTVLSEKYAISKGRIYEYMDNAFLKAYRVTDDKELRDNPSLLKNKKRHKKYWLRRLEIGLSPHAEKVRWQIREKERKRWNREHKKNQQREFEKRIQLIDKSKDINKADFMESMKRLKILYPHYSDNDMAHYLQNFTAQEGMVQVKYAVDKVSREFWVAVMDERQWLEENAKR